MRINITAGTKEQFITDSKEAATMYRAVYNF